MGSGESVTNTISRRAKLLFTLFGCSVAAVASCSKDELPRGEIMLAISADMSIPKNMNQVTVEVLDEGGHKLLQTYPIKPESLGQPMPGTLAIVPPDSGGQHVRIRLRAERDTGIGDPVVRVVREAVVAIPTDRVAMLTMPLRWLCDGKVVKADDGSFTSDCGKDQTCAAGICVDAKFESTTLANYDAAKVYGGGNDQGVGGHCIDIQACFANGTDVTPDADCKVPMPPEASSYTLNVAMVLNGTSDTTDGHCDDSTGRCYIPIDRDAHDGWIDDGSTVQLPPAVCLRLNEGKIQGVALSSACKTKDITVPICGPWTNVTESGEGPAGDGGPVGGCSPGTTRPCLTADLTCPEGSTPVETCDETGSVYGACACSGTVSVVDSGAPKVDGGGAGGSTTGRPDVGPPPCDGIIQQALPAATFVYFVIDQSNDMGQDPNIWGTLSGGIQAALDDPSWAGTAVGIELFGTQCGGSYLTPTVSPAPLPGSRTAVMSALASGPQSQAAPDLTQVMVDTYSFMQSASSVAPSSVVLLTAGTSGQCTLDTTTIAARAAQVFAAGVPTHVGYFPVSATNVSALDQIATAGGTNQARLIDVAAGATAFGDLLRTGVRPAGTCGFQTPDGKPLDLAASTIQISNAGAPVAVPMVDAAGACSDANGGFYLGADGTSFTLCPTSCGAASASGARVEIVSGCSNGGGGGPGTGGAAGHPAADASAGGGFGGAGGASGGTRCDSSAQCSPPTPFCSPAFTCVQCLGDADCAPGTCDTQTGTCLPGQ
jgi:hypothetical protein